MECLFVFAVAISAKLMIVCVVSGCRRSCQFVAGARTRHCYHFVPASCVLVLLSRAYECSHALGGRSEIDGNELDMYDIALSLAPLVPIRSLLLVCVLCYNVALALFLTRACLCT